MRLFRVSVDVDVLTYDVAARNIKEAVDLVFAEICLFLAVDNSLQLNVRQIGYDEARTTLYRQSNGEDIDLWTAFVSKEGKPCVIA